MRISDWSSDVCSSDLTLKTSVLGALNVLELARETKARILQASTAEVYGDPALHPQPESYWGNVNPVGIRSCYDEGKRAAETRFMAYRRQHALHPKLVGILNTNGPRMNGNDGQTGSGHGRGGGSQNGKNTE